MVELSSFLLLFVLIALVWAVRKVGDELVKANATLAEIAKEARSETRHPALELSN